MHAHTHAHTHTHTHTHRGLDTYAHNLIVINYCTDLYIKYITHKFTYIKNYPNSKISLK